MKKNSGFTLIEIIMYLALFAIIIGGGLGAAYQIIQGVGDSQNHTYVQQEVNFLLGKITWALQGSTVVSANQNTLIVQKQISGTASTLTFSLDNNNILLQQDSSSPIILNSSSVLVDGLNFLKTSGTNGMPGPITTVLSLRALGNNNPSQDFSMTKYIQ